MPARFGRFEILAELGQGSFATVYRARMTGSHGFSKTVALKILHGGPGRQNDAEVQSIINEARLGGRLKHPNIVELYDFGIERGRYFIAMEMVDGVPLDSVIKGLLTLDRDAPIGLVIHIARCVAEGLAEAHEGRGEDGRPLHVIHRDLKPQNIMLSRKGEVKILDFGIARSNASLFETAKDSFPKGTPAYMSPEQLEPSQGVDSRTDLFSFGVVVLELATLRHPFASHDFASLFHAILSRDLEPQLAQVTHRSQSLAGLLRRLLKRRVDERPFSASQVATELKRMEQLHPAEMHIDELLGSLQTSGPMPVPTASFPLPNDLATLEGPAMVPEPTDTLFEEDDGNDLFPEDMDALFAEISSGAPRTITDYTPVPDDIGQPTLGVPKSAVEDLPLIPEAPAAGDAKAGDKRNLLPLLIPWLIPLSVSALLIAVVLPIVLKDQAASNSQPVIVDQPDVEPPLEPEPAPPVVEPATPAPVVEQPTPKPKPVAGKAPTIAKQPTPVVQPPPATPPPEAPTPKPEPVVQGEPIQVYLNTIPWGRAYVDGRLLKNTPLKGDLLPAGSKTLRIESSGPDGGTKSYSLSGDPVQRLGCWDFTIKASCKR